MVLTGEDLASLRTIPLEEAGYHEIYPDIEKYTHPALAIERVLYVGQPVAAVFAETPYEAEDAAELVSVDYEDFPVVLDPVVALETDVSLFPGRSNEVCRIEKNYGDTDAALLKPHKWWSMSTAPAVIPAFRWKPATSLCSRTRRETCSLSGVLYTFTAVEKS